MLHPGGAAWRCTGYQFAVKLICGFADAERITHQISLIILGVVQRKRVAGQSSECKRELSFTSNEFTCVPKLHDVRISMDGNAAGATTSC